MAIIGWLFCVCVMAVLSFLSLLLIGNHGSKFTIGGAINSFTTKIYTWLFAALIIYGWMLIAQSSPFTVIVSH
jgi:hypothetical protein